MRHVLGRDHKGIYPIFIDPAKEAKKYQRLNLGGPGDNLFVVDFPTVEKNGWTLGYNQTSGRFDLHHNGVLVVSDQNVNICIRRAEFDTFGNRRDDGVVFFPKEE